MKLKKKQLVPYIVCYTSFLWSKAALLFKFSVCNIKPSKIQSLCWVSFDLLLTEYEKWKRDLSHIWYTNAWTSIFKNEVHKQVINQAIKALCSNINNIRIFRFYRDFVCIVEWHIFHITYILKAFTSGYGPVLLLNFSQRKLILHYIIDVHVIGPFTNLQLADGNIYFAVYFKHEATEQVKAKTLRWLLKYSFIFLSGYFLKLKKCW